MKKSFLFISCDEAMHICDKYQYGEATTWERIKLGIRLSWCKIVRAYSNKNKKLTKTIQTAKVDCLKKEERNKLTKQFHTELVKQQKHN